MSRAHVFIVTGANRGLGRSIVKLISQRAEANNETRHIIMVGRDQQALEEVAKADAKDAHTYIVSSIELGKPAHEITGPILSKLNEVLHSSPVASSVYLTLVNSAGTICDLSKTVDQYTEEEVTEYTAVNFVSFAALTSRFLARAKTVPNVERIAIANISSLLAVMPFANWGLYASIKAARDQLLKVVALENKDDPRVRTLSYAPGPLDNDMQAEVRASIGDAEQKQAYSDMHSKKKLVKTDDTAGILCTLLDDWTFDSGAHIDVYDIIGLPLQ
ncbi:hypothetical protein FBU31_000318 [Coemansia sp. 'formosensis']|nr:hypothetical protein FBU31_000318 [Coemansia sp. 'formosensis']